MSSNKNRNAKKNPKYIICRPSGGLNDTLNQIEICRKLSGLKRRTLVVQTDVGDKELTHRFDQPFESIFTFSSQVNSIDFDNFRELIGSKLDLSVFPSEYQPIKESLSKSIWEFTEGRFGGTKLKSSQIYKENLIIHESAGGGLASANLLSNLYLNENLFSIYRHLRSLVIEPVHGVHFRAFDWGNSKSELKFFLNFTLKSETVFFASDDQNLIENLHAEFEAVNFINLKSLLNQINIKVTITEAAILELLLLSSCNNLTIFELQRSEEITPKFSGYSRLAKHIWVVNKIKREGLLACLRSPNPIFGLSAGFNPFKNFLFLSFFEIPKIIFQTWFSRGIYKQLNSL